MSSHPHVEQFSHPPCSYRKQNCFLYTDWKDVDDNEAGKEARSRLKCWKRQAKALQKARISRISFIWETVTDQLGQTLCFHLPYFLENQIWRRSNKKCHLCVIWLTHLSLLCSCSPKQWMLKHFSTTEYDQWDMLGQVTSFKWSGFYTSSSTWELPLAFRKLNIPTKKKQFIFWTNFFL